MPTTTTTKIEEEVAGIRQQNSDTPMATPTKTPTTTTATRREDPEAAAATAVAEYTATKTAAISKTSIKKATEDQVAQQATPSPSPTPTLLPLLASAAACHKPLLFCRRFQDKRNFSSLPLFVYATSPSTHAHSADGVGVAKEAAAFSHKNEGFELPATHGISKTDGSCISHLSQGNGNGSGNHHHLVGPLRSTDLASGAMECLPMSSSAHHPHLMASAVAAAAAGGAVAASPTATVVVGATYPHHLHHHHLSHHTPYSNSYGSHHNIHSEQTKSLQELQHEVGALLEFRDLVIETFPDLKHKMASMSATPSTPTSSVGPMGGSHSVGGGSSSLATSRREWEPGIRMKRKLSHKEPSTSSATAANSSSGAEASSSSLTRSRSNSHSGKKEPKSGENNNGSVVQDSGFSTETSSSKEGHSASSTNGAMTVAIAANRLSCAESDDELLNLLDVIHRKSNRLREEVEQLQSYERQQEDAQKGGDSKGSGSKAMTPQQFREQVERLNREDIKQLRRERDRLLDKLAEMEAETLTGRIKAAKMSDQVEELIGVKKDLEEQLKLAMAQKLELSSRVQQLQQMQQQQSKSSSSASQSDFSSQRNFLSSATTVLSNGSRQSHNTFQPVVLDQPAQEAFHQSSSSDIATLKKQQQQSLGRLDGIVSTPGVRNSKCRLTDSKRFAAILLETNVLELQRHLLTLSVQNQVLAQKLESSSKSKTQLTKRLDKSFEDSEHLRYQLEEKSIELEGTKAQLRLVESRLQASNSTANSYLNSSQHDYETNRSSASTTLMLSRRGVSDSVDSTSTAMPAPPVTQISTPSMKAMVPLAMDELQQHSSSTESAHEHENQQQQQQNQQQPGLRTPNSTLSKTITASPCPVGSSTPSSIAARVMSTSVGGVSPFDSSNPTGRQSAFRKFNSTSKPSKIPLPGSKAAAYFTGKPPTGRPATAGRSPPSAHNSSSTSYGSKSSLSRSTGNLQSLRRADTSASNHSLSTNTSRSSTSSSIPLATTPYSSGSTGGNRSQPAGATTPSPRVLQNSPLPKLKRDTISSRVRHLDSLSREGGGKGGITGGSIAAQLSSTLRKDLQLSGNSAAGAPYHHRRSAHSPASERAQALGVSRRYSSASAGGNAGRTIGRDQGDTLGLATTPTSSFGDSDSGKYLANPPVEKPNFRPHNQNWQLWQTNMIEEEFLHPRQLFDVSEETAYDSYYTHYTSPDSMDCGSDNLLVTFDYGYSDSIEARADTDPGDLKDDRGEGADPDADAEGAIWFGTPSKDKKEANLFEVHHVQHKLLDDSMQSLISYDVDDFEEEELSDAEPDQDEEIFYDSIECV
ncbi:serine-rich adhesin for platelets isoform X1 [Drosophila bipectinata]|uniref:serine-rich adhesin for platelets isoform X1 n=1 Tax=Drosophila bipectinata TaxID=42026 RepID=UPI001C89D003|nr:serine-rich adhesin for platelets isoform X1 [Drosophila bipectinata]